MTSYHRHHPTSHPFGHHKEFHVGKRAVKHILASGGYSETTGAHPQNGHKMIKSRLRQTHEGESFHTGEMYKGNLGSRSRAYKHGGSVVGKVRGALKAVEAHEKAERKEGYAFGGGVHKITPSKHKPHLSVNVFNIHKGHKMMPGGAPMLGAGAPPPLPVPPSGAGPGGPPMAGGAPPMRPPGMKRGGKIKLQMGGMPAGGMPMMARRPPMGVAPGMLPGVRPPGMKKGGAQKRAFGGATMHPLVANRRARLAGAPHVAAARTAARIAAAPHMARAARAGRMATGLPPEPFAKGGGIYGAAKGESISGISTAGNIAKWAKYAQKDSRISNHKKGGRITGMKQVDSPQLDDIRDDAASGWPKGKSHPKMNKMVDPRVLPEGHLRDVEPTTAPPTGITKMKPAMMRQGRRFSGGMGTLEETRHYQGKWPPRGGGK